METEDKLSLLREILYNRYTEDNVDIIKNTAEGHTVIIYYPEVVIYKDFDSNNPIYRRKNIYAIVYISNNYLLVSVKFISSSYTEAELYYKFVLPHVSSGLFPIDGGRYGLSYPCLGKTNYFRAYDLTLELDILNFLEDIEKFMSTESPSGVPFKPCNVVATYNPKVTTGNIKLIGNNNIINQNVTRISLDNKVNDILLDFIDTKLEDILEILKFSYMDGKLIPTNIYKYAIYKFSKVFEDYISSLNEDKIDLINYLYYKRVLYKVTEINGDIYVNTITTNVSYERTLIDFKKTYVCIFKGNKIYPTLILNKEEEIKEITIVNPQLLQRIINKIKCKGLTLQYKENESNNNREITD